MSGSVERVRRDSRTLARVRARACRTCGTTQTEDFGREHTICRRCNAARSRAWAEKNRGRRRESQRRSRQRKARLDAIRLNVFIKLARLHFEDFERLVAEETSERGVSLSDLLSRDNRA